jgi:glycosyltransferase involved in cell wall biosynthesis
MLIKIKNKIINIYNYIKKLLLIFFNKKKLISTKKLIELNSKIHAFCNAVASDKSINNFDIEQRTKELRQIVRLAAGLPSLLKELRSSEDLLSEFMFHHDYAYILSPAFKAFASRRVLFCGQCYYNNWYLSRSLRSLGWKADVYNWDLNTKSQIYYHGQDFKLGENVKNTLEGILDFYLKSFYNYDIIHFSNMNGISYGSLLESVFKKNEYIYLLKDLGKKIFYSNNGCLDGVSQTSFAKWGPESVCSICIWQNKPSICNDKKNLAWGHFRNSVSDFQITLGGNRIDYNDDPRVHEVPEYYCLDPELWQPNIAIPKKYQLPALNHGSIRLYHAIGNKEVRTKSDGVNIKSSHVYLPLIDKLRTKGMQIELINSTNIPNKEVRFLQVQADIFLDMLTYGWFGATAREAMMLGKPVICFIRPEWLESVREEIPDYAKELPIISATPQTVENILCDLIINPEKRKEIGQRSREFAVKWHSMNVAGRRFDQIYGALLSGERMLRKKN